MIRAIVLLESRISQLKGSLLIKDWPELNVDKVNEEINQLEKAKKILIKEL